VEKNLSSVLQYRAGKRKIDYLDDTWFSGGYTRLKVWVDATVGTRKWAFLYGLSTVQKRAREKVNCSRYR